MVISYLEICLFDYAKLELEGTACFQGFRGDFEGREALANGMMCHGDAPTKRVVYTDVSKRKERDRVRR